MGRAQSEADPLHSPAKTQPVGLSVVSVTDMQAARHSYGVCVCKAILSNMLNAFGNSQSPSGPSYTTVLLSLQRSDKDHFYFFLRSLGMYLNTSRQPPNLLPSCLIVVTPIIVLKELCFFPPRPQDPKSA